MANIIAIDDNPSVLDTVVNILEAVGYSAKGILNGGVGVQVVRDRLPDLVICDIKMPGFDGYDVLRELRLDPATASIPVIFLTAQSERDDMRAGMELGADDYITKPFSARELLAAVNTQLEKHKAIATRYESTLRLLRKNIMYALPHELRTPLGGILGYAGVLELDADSLSPDDLRQIGDRLVKAGKRLHRVLENYLVYAQIEIMASDPAEVAALRNHITSKVDKLIGDVAQAKAEEAHRSGDLQVNVDNVALQIAEHDLNKILNELIDNAFKFSQPGTPVQVNGVREERRYTISIRDYGRGMTKDQIGQIGAYMQFERVMHEQQGLGLGLIIAKRLSELHNAELIIKSKPNHGVEVKLTFAI
ncbi:MAG: hybrid sensor histidine kinase/response regulator [Anaerolineae bacterium]|nr:hybrid sensor histidine kinase/response regulator [Anaerolineae bacterium]